jgi:hypothetical protein
MSRDEPGVQLKPETRNHSLRRGFRCQVGAVSRQRRYSLRLCKATSESRRQLSYSYRSASMGSRLAAFLAG